MRHRNRFEKYQQVFALVIATAILWSCSLTVGRAQRTALLARASLQTVDKASLHQALLDLTNPWTVMCVAAHPDDEDGTTLTLLRRKFGVHTVSLFSTYGEGGQNAIGPELYEELGVIRAKETMRAAEIQGSEPYFLGLRDFGFSKSAEEAFSVWGHDEALKRMVFKIRELRPDVIITNHDTSHGHGHHQATGRLIIEAFDAAADAKRFPEQLSKVKPWQAQRLFVRVFGAGGASNKTAKVVSIDPNEVDPIRGTSFAEQALQALQQHATQGPWPKSVADMLRTRRIENAKLPLIRYELEREAPGAPKLPDGASTLLDGLAANAASGTTDGNRWTGLIDQPENLLAELTKWRVETSHLPANDAATETRASEAFAHVAGISLTLKANTPVMLRGETTNFTITLANAGSKPVHVGLVTLWSWNKKLTAEAPDQLLPDTEATINIESTTPVDAAYTVPPADHLYDGLLFGAPFKAAADIDLDGAKFEVTDSQKVDVVPAIEITRVAPSPCVRTEETLGRCRELVVGITNHTSAPFRGTVKTRIDREAGQRTEVTRPLVIASQETGNESVLTSNKIPRREDLRGLRRSRSAVISIYNQRNELITERDVRLVYSDALVKPNLRVGYVASFDQTLEQSLAALGVESKALTISDIQGIDLSAYHTIILDNRAYEAHPELIPANSRLLDFVNGGGSLIVFYHKSNEWNPDPNRNRAQLAPYPIILGDERVTDETAPIGILQPQHALLNSPNRITAADFKDWIQERGLYYPKEWDSHYTALFTTNDKGETPLNGGLLVGKYGKGNYIYTSMVWYRQLRAGVPGAYRMFANMISYGPGKN